MAPGSALSREHRGGRRRDERRDERRERRARWARPRPRSPVGSNAPLERSRAHAAARTGSARARARARKEAGSGGRARVSEAVVYEARVSRFAFARARDGRAGRRARGSSSLLVRTPVARGSSMRRGSRGARFSMAGVEARERAARTPSRSHSSPRRALVSRAFGRARRAPAPSASDERAAPRASSSMSDARAKNENRDERRSPTRRASARAARGREVATRRESARERGRGE